MGLGWSIWVNLIFSILTWKFLSMLLNQDHQSVCWNMASKDFWNGYWISSSMFHEHCKCFDIRLFITHAKLWLQHMIVTRSYSYVDNILHEINCFEEYLFTIQHHKCEKDFLSYPPLPMLSKRDFQCSFSWFLSVDLLNEIPNKF